MKQHKQPHSFRLNPDLVKEARHYSKNNLTAAVEFGLRLYIRAAKEESQLTHRLRAFALKEISNSYWRVNDEAVCALVNEPDPDAWRLWQETQAEEGQWFLWRDPKDPDDLHADKAGI